MSNQPNTIAVDPTLRRTIAELGEQVSQQTILAEAEQERRTAQDDREKALLAHVRGHAHLSTDCRLCTVETANARLHTEVKSYRDAVNTLVATVAASKR